MSGNIDQIFNVVVRRFADDTVKLLKANIRKDGTVASGSAVNSITYTTPNNDVLLNYDNHLDIVSKGIGVGKQVRVANILTWMNEKGIVPRSKPNTLAGRKSTAFIIARSMERNGTIKRFANKGTDVMNSIGVGTTLYNRLQDDIEEAGIEYMNELIKNIKL